MKFLVCTFTPEGHEDLIKKMFAEDFSAIIFETSRRPGKTASCKIFTNCESTADLLLEHNKSVTKKSNYLEAFNDISGDVLNHFGEVIFYPP